jgi:hypothetical protein
MRIRISRPSQTMRKDHHRPAVVGGFGCEYGGIFVSRYRDEMEDSGEESAIRVSWASAETRNNQYSRYELCKIASGTKKSCVGAGISTLRRWNPRNGLSFGIRLAGVKDSVLNSRKILSGRRRGGTEVGDCEFDVYCANLVWSSIGRKGRNGRETVE